MQIDGNNKQYFARETTGIFHKQVINWIYIPYIKTNTFSLNINT